MPPGFIISPRGVIIDRTRSIPLGFKILRRCAPQNDMCMGNIKIPDRTINNTSLITLGNVGNIVQLQILFHIIATYG